MSQYHRFVAYMKTRVHRPEDVKTWAQPTSLLNLKLTYGDDYIMISQPNFIDKLLQAANMENCKPISSFNPTGEMRFQEADCPTTEDEKAYMSKIDYRKIIGSLLWISLMSRPVLSNIVRAASSFLNNPG